MKKIFFIVTIVCSVLLFSACTGEVPEDYSVSGKTFYDSSDTFVNKEPSSVWFGADGSFVLKDIYSEGFDEYTGNWKIEKRVVTLEAKDKMIIFEAVNDNSVVLRTSLKGSNSDAVFTTDKPVIDYSGSNNPSGNDGPDNPDIPYGYEVAYEGYYNSSQNGTVSSYIEIREDKSFTLIDYKWPETVEVNGLYGLTDDGKVYMFSNFDPFEDYEGNKVYNFEMKRIDDNVLQLLTNLAGSFTGDYFTIDGSKYTGSGSNSGFEYTTTSWIHEPIDDVNKQFYPRLTIATDFSFKLVENVYAGMGEYTGYCQKVDTGWVCDVLDASKMQGFAGDDVKVIEFIENDGYLYIQTDLCMTRKGDRFIKN